MVATPAETGFTVDLFAVADHYPSLPRPAATFYREMVEQAVLGEELGYEAFWMAEHHFHEYGAVPNPAAFLSAVAARTIRLKLGPAVVILPFRNPLTVAEDYAMLDMISGGRLLFGVGSGYLKHEFAGFGLTGEDKRERFDEALTVIRRAWTGERFSHHGRFFSLDDVAINIVPVQSPQPPPYIAVLRREAAFHVGRQGHRLLTVPYATLDRLEEVGALVAEYHQGHGESGADPDAAELGIAFHTFVGESDATVRRDAAEAFDLYVATRLYAKSQVYDDILRSRLALFGSVERVSDMLVELYGMGVRRVMLLQNFGGLGHDKVVRSMRLVSDEVMPRVRAKLKLD